jgi:hypothetical protein
MQSAPIWTALGLRQVFPNSMWALTKCAVVASNGRVDDAIDSTKTSWLLWELKKVTPRIERNGADERS